MEITVQLPDDLVAHPNPGREALEALAIEGYRNGTFSPLQAGQLLDMDRFEFEGLLKDRQIFDQAYGVADLEDDLQTLAELRNKRLARS